MHIVDSLKLPFQDILTFLCNEGTSEYLKENMLLYKRSIIKRILSKIVFLNFLFFICKELQEWSRQRRHKLSVQVCQTTPMYFLIIFKPSSSLLCVHRNVCICSLKTPVFYFRRGRKSCASRSLCCHYKRF